MTCHSPVSISAPSPIIDTLGIALAKNIQPTFHLYIINFVASEFEQKINKKTVWLGTLTYQIKYQNHFRKLQMWF